MGNKRLNFDAIQGGSRSTVDASKPAVDKVDAVDASNPQYIVPYLQDIHRHYREAEVRAPLPSRPFHLAGHPGRLPHRACALPQAFNLELTRAGQSLFRFLPLEHIGGGPMQTKGSGKVRDAAAGTVPVGRHPGQRAAFPHSPLWERSPPPFATSQSLPLPCLERRSTSSQRLASR